ncbi:peptidylprolyl isomerase [Abyssalbus ytuae]|uniref:Periplasmic chaperone PpiD n=1 Tax=Abyssalbus ytuae TaxID=2926907 RepID=A0A9E7A0L9_9FLAO|nr:peptidylprolyl isomerase [Abyssalbus ytuae]UOB18727.1 peptidylprolyl isomerase [Abyssalbus ytuae]
MAILNQIRSKKIVLILVIALALLAFVVGAGDFLGGGSGSKSIIGEVNGEVISRDDFVRQVEGASRNRNINSSTLQVVNQVWEREVRNQLLSQEFEKLGINIEKDQIINVIKSNPAFASNPNFQNEAGVFDEQKVIDFVRELKASSPAGYQQWQLQEDALIEASKENSYFNLIKAGVGATLKEGEFAYKLEGDKVDIKYVQVPYSSVADSLVTVTDSEIQKYISEHKDEFDEEASRSVRYVYFEEKPSQEDEEAIKQSLEALLKNKVVYNEQTKQNDTIAGFATTVDAETFVNANSDVKYDSLYLAKKDLPAAFADTLYTLKKGEVFGPYKDGNQYKISRMLSRSENGSVKASHILIGFDGGQSQPKEPRTKEEAETLAKEILEKVNKTPDSFADLAKEYSEDPGSANNGGTYDNITRGQMVPAFNDYIFNNEIGKAGIVETVFGYHIVRVDDKYEGVQLATITRNIEASEKTINDIYTNTTKFEMEAADTDFSEVAQKNGYTVRPVAKLKALDENIPGVGNQRGLVQWTFNPETKVGDVKRFNINNGYIVAQLTRKAKKGVATVNSARARVLPILRKEKKADLIIKDNSGKSLDELATSNKTSVRAATGLNMKSPTITGAGREPKVVGTAFTLAQGEVSGLIKGENGVYKVEVTRKEEAKALDNYISYVNTQKTLNRNRSNYAAYNALKEAADIEDNRADFY